MRHASHTAVLLLTVGTVNCVDFSVTNPPLGGGVRNQPGECDIRPASAMDPWYTQGFNGGITLPSRCPYVVDSDVSNITAAWDITAPKDNTDYSYPLTFWGLVSEFNGHGVMSGMSRYWTDHPTTPSLRLAQFAGSYHPGYIVPGGPVPWSRDTGSMSAQSDQGTARGLVRLSGGQAIHGASYLVSDAVGAGNGGRVRAVTDVDTNSYNFTWLVNGQSVNTNNAWINVNFEYPGTYTIKAFAQYWTGTDTISGLLHVPLFASIIGPSEIAPNENYTWSANVPGGYPPYTYQWYVDNNPVDNASSLTRMFEASSQHEIRVDVTDNQGHFTESETRWVYVSSGDCQPGEPGCYESLKAPDTQNVVPRWSRLPRPGRP